MMTKSFNQIGGLEYKQKNWWGAIKEYARDPSLLIPLGATAIGFVLSLEPDLFSDNEYVQHVLKDVGSLTAGGGIGAAISYVAHAFGKKKHEKEMEDVRMALKNEIETERQIWKEERARWEEQQRTQQKVLDYLINTRSEVERLRKELADEGIKRGQPRYHIPEPCELFPLMVIDEHPLVVVEKKDDDPEKPFPKASGF